MFRALILSLSFCFHSLASAEIASAWQQSLKSAVRLVGDEGLGDGVYQAGVEIRLDPKTITYWRTPGDAGVPPLFDFSASENVADIVVSYPVPKRIAEAGGVEAFGYEQSVIFPLRIRPKDPAKPVLLVMDLKYAACEKICVPAQAQAMLDLAVVPSSQPKNAVLAAARAKVPTQMIVTGAQEAMAGAWVGGKTVWTFPANDDPSMQKTTDVFVEAPEGWYFETRPGIKAGEFHITLADRPKSWADNFVVVQLTFAGANHSLEYALPLALPKP